MQKSVLLIMMISGLLSVSAFATDPSHELGLLVPAEEIERPPVSSDTPPAPSEHVIPDDSTCNDPIKVWWFRCFANNAAGVLFAAIGKEPQETQDRAMNRCFLLPPSVCRPLGCRVEY